MIKRKLQLFGWVVTGLLFITACQNEKRSIDYSKTTVAVDIYRFDEYLAENQPISKESVRNVQEDFPAFYDAFVQSILRPGNQPPYHAMQQFQTYFDSIGVNKMIAEEFQSITNIENDFLNVQRKLKTVFPTYKPVGLITMNSGFNYKNFLLQNYIVVGLDMYLDDSVDYVQMGQQFPAYKLETFQREYILPDIATTLLQDVFPDTGENNTLLDQMIYNGKQLWLKELLLGKSKPNQLIELTEKEYDWLVANERQIWRYFISEELLYSNDFGRFKTYISDGPFSSGMPEDAPANTGSFIGWQIVKTYAKKHPEKEIAAILSINDSQQILNDSQYRP